jgi:hypothetical protein
MPELEAQSYSLVERHHVPRSQVWEGSRGRQSGNVHLHVRNGPAKFTAANGRTLTRGGGVSLCGRNGWYEREPCDGEQRCPRCVELAARYGVPWPEPPDG